MQRIIQISDDLFWGYNMIVEVDKKIIDDKAGEEYRDLTTRAASSRQ